MMLCVGMWYCFVNDAVFGRGSSDGMAEEATLPSLLSVSPSGGIRNGDGKPFL